MNVASPTCSNVARNGTGELANTFSHTPPLGAVEQSKPFQKASLLKFTGVARANPRSLSVSGAHLVAEHQASEGTCKIEIDFAGAPGSARISALQVAPRRMLPPEAL